MSYTEQATRQPCTSCGKLGRLKIIRHKSKRGPFGPAPFLHCYACGSNAPIEAESVPDTEPIPAETRRNIYALYTEITKHCHALLYSDAGRDMLHYLYKRGFTDATIQTLELGFSPNRYIPGNVEAWIAARGDQLTAEWAGLTSVSGRQKSILNDTIIIPYHDGTNTGKREVVTLRARKLDPHAPVKYLSPSGTPYAGGRRALYLIDELNRVDSNTKRVMLTEGEFKAASALQAWRTGLLDRPAVAIAGVGMLHADMIQQLTDCEVTIILDTEQRRDPFVLSAGEDWTIRNGNKLTGIDKRLEAQRLEHELSKAKGLDEDTRAERQQEIEQLYAYANEIAKLNIRVKVARLPRDPDVEKVDLDGFLLEHGPAALQKILDAAHPFRQWYERRGACDYYYQNGTTRKRGNHETLANYQAIITEDQTIDNGETQISAHQIVMLAPSGRRTTAKIDGDAWADQRKAMQALRAAIGEGSADDLGTETLKAIKHLSARGDGPARRTVYTATGWQQLGTRWAYLMPDGAIYADRIDLGVCAELDAATGNHYALCCNGSAQQGAQAFLALLRGVVCTQDLGLLLSATAALPLVHRFTKLPDRPMLWLYGESGNGKTSLARAVASLYGPAFTGTRGGGGALIKWDSTPAGLEQHLFIVRDGLQLVDDYKQATSKSITLATLLHNYSEGTSRTRARVGGVGRNVKADKGYAARCIVIATGEDRPVADPGVLARLIIKHITPNTINLDALAEMQTAGERGDLAVFWRGFVQWIAARLDQRAGLDQFKTYISDRIMRDDQALPSHKRTVGALRQLRAAFLLLLDWMLEAGYIDASEHDQLNNAFLEARATLAAVQAAQQHDERPSTLFLSYLIERISTGELLIEDQDQQPIDSPALADRVIGFMHHGDIALYPDKAYTLFQDARRRAGMVMHYSKAALFDYLRGDNVLAQRDERHNKNTAVVKRRGSSIRVLVLSYRAVYGDPGEVTPVTHTPDTMLSGVTHATAAPSGDELSAVTQVTQVTPVIHTYIQDKPAPSTEHDQKMHTLFSDRCNCITDSGLCDCGASNSGYTVSNEKCNPATSAAIKALPNPHLRSAYDRQVRAVRMFLAPADPLYAQVATMPIADLQALEAQLRDEQRPKQ